MGVRCVRCGLIGDWELTSQNKNREGCNLERLTLMLWLVYSSHAIAKSKTCIAVCTCERVGGEWRTTATDGSCRVSVENVVKEK